MSQDTSRAGAISRLNRLLYEMWHRRARYGERAKKLAEAMTEYEASGGAAEDVVIRGWTLVYYFRWCPPPPWAWPVDIDYHCEGGGYRDQVIRGRTEGKLGLRPPGSITPGSMTKPAKR